MNENRLQQGEADKRAKAQTGAETSAQTQKRATTQDADDESAAKVKADEGIATEGKHQEDSVNEPVADRDTDYFGIDEEGEYNQASAVTKTNRSSSYKRINRACCMCMLSPNVFKKRQPEPTIASNDNYARKLH